MDYKWVQMHIISVTGKESIIYIKPVAITHPVGSVQVDPLGHVGQVLDALHIALLRGTKQRCLHKVLRLVLEHTAIK